MREKTRFLACFIAVAIACAPAPAFPEEFAGFSRDNLSVGLELNVLNKGLDAATVTSGTSRLTSAVPGALQVDTSLDRVHLTEVLLRADYRINDHFTPYLLLGSSALSYDERYQVNLNALLSADTDVPYSDSFSLGYGFGAAGVLMELPARTKLSYGMRMITFTSSDGAAVPPEAVSTRLTQLNPIEDVNFSTAVTFREWDFSLGVSRVYQLDDAFALTPELGYRHSSISMKTTTEIEYSPGMPNYLKGEIERSLGGSLSSVTLGVTLGYLRSLSATLQTALGDETGISLAVTYGL